MNSRSSRAASPTKRWPRWAAGCLACTGAGARSSPARRWLARSGWTVERRSRDPGLPEQPTLRRLGQVPRGAGADHTVGQGVQKRSAIALADQSPVEHGDYAAVGAAPNEAPEALLEAE